jgi:hypothetical protein
MYMGVGVAALNA